MSRGVARASDWVMGKEGGKESAEVLSPAPQQGTSPPPWQIKLTPRNPEGVSPWMSIQAIQGQAMLETVTYQFSFPREEFYPRYLKVVWRKPSRSPWLQRATKCMPFLGWLISKHLVTLHNLLIQEKLRQCGQTMVVPDCHVGLAEVFTELYNYWISPYTIFFQMYIPVAHYSKHPAC